MSNSDQKDDKTEALDLGLGSFLSPDDAGKPAQVTKELVDEGIQEVAADLSEFALLAQAKDWKALLSTSESVLGEKPLKLEAASKWIEAQAWWIVAQVEIDSLPAAVLLAPLEGLLEILSGFNDSEKETKEFKSNSDLVKNSASRLAAKLFSLDEMTSAMHLLSRTRILGGNLDALKKVVQQFSEKLNSLSGSDHRLFLILCKELGVDSSHLNKNSISSKKDTFSSESPNKSSVLKLESKRNSDFIRLVILIGLFIIFLLVVFYLLFSESQQPASFPKIASKTIFTPPALAVPTPAPVEKVGELDAVLYGMGKKSPEGEAPSSDQKIIHQQPQYPRIVPTQVREKLEVKGPRETEEIRILREKNKPGNKSSEKDRGSLVPGPAIAPRFENFPKAKVYTIVRPTNLMRKPSFNSDAVAGLSRGDRVKVEGMEGYWLRIRSREGKIAYVLAEDTQPE